MTEAEERPFPERAPETYVVRHEEEAVVEPRWRGAGFLRARRTEDAVRVREQFALDGETVVEERVPVEEGDSGRIQTLPDGSISIPIYAEELVVTKRVVLRERIVIRKVVESRTARVEGELRRERLELEADDPSLVVDETGAG